MEHPRDASGNTHGRCQDRSDHDRHNCTLITDSLDREVVMIIFLRSRAVGREVKESRFATTVGIRPARERGRNGFHCTETANLMDRQTSKR